MSIGKPPPGAEVVRTYCDLDKHVAAFFEGRYQLLVVIGAPGLSCLPNAARSMAVRPAMPKSRADTDSRRSM